MFNELRNWLDDLSRYPALGKRLLGIPGPEGAADYRSPEYRDLRSRVVGAIHPARMELEVVDLVDETRTGRTLRMRRVDGPLPPFRAGQYVNLFLELEGVRTSRPYSISSAPGGDTLDLTIREVPGGFVSGYLANDVAVGSRFETTGPQGAFRYEPLIDGTELVFLAGGSGITPCMAMIRHAARQNWPYTVHLLYGNRTPEDVLFREELDDLARTHRQLRVDYVFSDAAEVDYGHAGLLDEKLLRKLLTRRRHKRYFLCGPNPMTDLVLASLAALDVPRHRVRSELYGPPRDITGDPAWPRELAPDHEVTVTLATGERFSAPAGEPLLNSLERHGHVVPAVCRAGECSACRVRLLSGRVLIPEGHGIRAADVKAGTIHCCVSYPLEDLELGVIS